MTDLIKKISVLIDRQLPEFVRTNHPTFVAFLKAYYEWLEQPENAVYWVGTFEDNKDIDKSLDRFIAEFSKKYLRGIPGNVLANKRLLAKNIKDFYAARGTEKSYEFLFRILYDEDVDFYYPKEDILRASDGKWVRELKVFVFSTGDDPFLFERTTFVGSASGASGFVDIVRQTVQGSFTVYEFILTTVDGEFEIGEVITATTAEGDIIEAEIAGYVSGFEITDPGLDYEIGDFVPVTDLSGNGVNALGQVAQTYNTGAITSFDINDGGSNYIVGDPIIFDESNTPGFGAIAKVSAVTPDRVIVTDITIIGTVQNVVLDTIDTIVIQDYIDFDTFTLGAITDIEIIDGGQNYNPLPTATVGQKNPRYGLPEGINADIDPRSDAEGAILQIKVINPGIGYIEHPVYPEADLTGSGNGLATANVLTSGGPLLTDGFFRNTDGHLSSDKYLQDGYYYQIFSYVLKAERSINTYRDIVKRLLHPAGMALFGEVDLTSYVDAHQNDVGVELPEDYSEYVVEPEALVDARIQLREVPPEDIVVHAQKHINLAHPIFIYHYEDEIIDSYDLVVLEDFPGFTQERSYFARESIIDVIP